ncbi:MAG: phosphate signaling complex protein PhoU [Pirellulaceae bacterium]
MVNELKNEHRRSKHLQRSLDRMQTDLLSLFGIVEQMINKAVQALYQRDITLADEVIKTDRTVDQREVAIEDDCLKLLALHQPVAGDLRWTTTVIKVNSDLERMADLACNIAERAKALTHFPLFPIPDDFQTMVSEATTMVSRALDSFVESDTSLALNVMRSDDRIDELNRNLIHELREVMKGDPESVEPALHCFSAARHLERIADLAENIAEDVIFLVEGEIIRHKPSDFAKIAALQQQNASGSGN